MILYKFTGIGFIPLGTVDNNLGPYRLSDPTALTLLQTANSLITRPLSGNPNLQYNELRLFWDKALSLLILLMSHI